MVAARRGNPKILLQGGAASKQCPRTLGGSEVCSGGTVPSRGIPELAFRFPGGPLRDRPRPPPLEGGIFRIYGLATVLPRVPFFAHRTQRPHLNLKGKPPPALQRAARARARAPRICPSPAQPRPGPRELALHSPSRTSELGEPMLPAPARSRGATAGTAGEGSRAQPAPSGSRDLSSAAAGPRDKLSPEAGRRGRGGAAYRVRRAGRQAAARPTAASWCRRRSRRRSLPPRGPAWLPRDARRRVPAGKRPGPPWWARPASRSPASAASSAAGVEAAPPGDREGVSQAQRPRPPRRSPRHRHRAWSRP